MISNTRLDELAAMEQAATDAPWDAADGLLDEAISVKDFRGIELATIGELEQCVDDDGDLNEIELESMKADAEFIATARNEFAAMIEQCREANRLRKDMTFIREGLAAWLDNAQHNRQRMDKEIVVGCLERLIVDAEQSLKGQAE